MVLVTFCDSSSLNWTTFQIELDKTAEDFRKAHQERQELIRQWENTIEQMQRRDKEMDLLAAVSYRRWYVPSIF